MRGKLFFFLLIIFLIIGGLGFWYYQSRSFSKEVLKLEILGLDSVKLGEEAEYLVKFKNNGDVNLEDAQLIFEYPQYSLLSEEEQLRKEMKLETIYPGQERTLSFKTRLFGREGEQKIAKAWLSFRPKNLESRFESATTKTTIISSVPLTFEFDLPTKVEADKEIRFRLNYFSNADYPLSNLRILVDYPPDFEFIEARPFSLEKNEWELGLLNKADGGRIEIAGKFSGKTGHEKLLRAKLGMWQGEDFILLKETIKGVEIVLPRLFLSQQINSSLQYIASPGDALHYEIFFKNIGQEPLTNLFLVAKLEGKPFDLQTLKSENGNFKAGDNSIIFDGRSVPALQFLNSQEEGKVEFWIELKKEWPISGSQDKNAIVKNKISLSQAQEEFMTKINSKLEIDSKAYFEDEVFGNAGPLPPKTGETTTFTVIWQAKNYYNDVDNVKVKATLPQNVKLTGKIFPEDAKLTFDSQSREIVWDLGKMEAGQGVISPAPNIAFQLAFSPSFDQKDEPAQLLSEVKISAEDEWTNIILEAISPALDTSLTD